MHTFNYDAIIRDMVTELGRRINVGEDMHDAAFSIAGSSRWLAYTMFHYKILDACKVDPRLIAEEYGYGVNEDFAASVSRTARMCLCRDVIDAYMNRDSTNA